MFKHRKTRVALAALAAVLAVGSAAGTASGAGQSVFYEVWAQLGPLLGDPGTINSADNPVHFTKLKGVPATLADGVDNGIDRAGFGLKRNLYPNLEFAVDTAKIQQRITRACPAGQAVQSIAANGTVTCSAPRPVVYHGFDESAKGFPNADPIGNDWSTIGGGLDLPAGSYTFVAKVGFAGAESVFCRLETWVPGAGSSTRDEIWTNLEEPVAGRSVLPLTLTGVHSSATAFRVAVVCRDSHDGSSEEESGARWYDVNILATQVAELHQQVLS